MPNPKLLFGFMFAYRHNSLVGQKAKSRRQEKLRTVSQANTKNRCFYNSRTLVWCWVLISYASPGDIPSSLVLVCIVGAILNIFIDILIMELDKILVVI